MDILNSKADLLVRIEGDVWDFQWDSVALEDAQLPGFVLQGAVLYGANMRGANLRGADFYWAIARECDLTYA